MADISKLNIAPDSSEPTFKKAQDQPVDTANPTPGQIIARDITKDFHAAVSGLNTSQLVKDDFFTLFEAVGALEIMDPKMDSGYLTAGDSLDDDYDVLQELLPEEVIGIMDQLLCFEMAWHMGYPLSQSLFTSLYLDRLLWPEPKTLEQARFVRDGLPQGNDLLHLVLRAYCLGLIKTCDFVHRRITAEHFYEEEDFVANLYHRKLLTDFEIAQVEQTLDDAIYSLNVQNAKIKETLKDALVGRLELRKGFLSAVRIDEIVDRHRAVSWERCMELLPSIKQTTSLGVLVDESFSVKVQRRLASSVPPRPIVSINFDDAYAFLGRLCQHGKDAYKILEYHGGVNLLTFVWGFQSRTPQPAVYIRSLLQSLIFSEMRVLGTMSFRRLLFDDLEEIVLPADLLVDPANGDIEAPQDPRFQVLKKMDAFVTRAADPYLDIFRTVCMNKSRLRRMLCHLVLDWDSVQFDAEVYDTELRTYTKEQPLKESKDSNEEIWAFPLSSWAYYHKLRQIEWIIQMGFELDIYQVDELAGLYWYLQHVASTRLQHMERIRTFATRSLARISKPSNKQKTAFRRSFSFIDYTMLEASATQSFADGLSCLFSFLSHVGLMPPPYHAMPYSTPEYRYTLRMRPFLSMSLPETPSYDEFTSLISLRTPDKPDTDSSNTSAASHASLKEQALSILEVADQALKVARKEWEAVSKANAETARCVGCEDWWTTSVKNVLRACITANIMVATAKKTVASAGSESIRDALSVELADSGRGYHPWWIVPRITAK